MRIVLDFYKDNSGRVLSLAKELSGYRKDVQMLAAVPADTVPPLGVLRRCIERWIPRQNIRVWESPGPEPVSYLLHTACVAGLAPDVVVTSRPNRLTALPCVDVGAIPETLDWTGFWKFFPPGPVRILLPSIPAVSG